MSRHTLEPRCDGTTRLIVVGWDRPAWTFFAQVEDHVGELVVDLGTADDPVLIPGVVLDAVRGYAAIPPGFERQLLRDAVDTGATAA